MEKQKLTQQKHTLTDQKKCSTMQKVKPGLVASYDWKRRGPILVSALHKFVAYLLRHLSSYLRPWDPHGAVVTKKPYYNYYHFTG